MKFICFFLVVMSSSVYSMDATNFYTGPAVTKERNISSNDKAIAEFAEMFVSKATILAKSVREENGTKIVDVVIVDKLCHVTVDQSTGEMKVSKFICEEVRSDSSGKKTK